MAVAAIDPAAAAREAAAAAERAARAAEAARLAAPPPPVQPALQVAQPAPQPPAQTIAPTPGPQVANAEATIDRGLAGTGPFGLTTPQDTRAISDTLNRLSPQDANAVVGDLTRSPKLNQVSDQITGATLTREALPATERQQLFANLAGKLDGNNLAAFTRSLSGVGREGGATAPNAFDGADRSAELAGAIATHASPEAKQQFVTAMAPGIVDPAHAQQTNRTETVTQEGTVAARSVATVIGGLRGDNAQAAFISLSGEQRTAVFEAALGKQTTPPIGETQGTTSFDTQRVGALTDAIASFRDPHAKAQAFATGAQVLAGTQQNQNFQPFSGIDPAPFREASNDLANGLAKIISSDPSAVTRQLADNTGVPGDIATADGAGITAYAKQMELMGDRGKGILAAQLAYVGAGSEGARDAVSAFNTPIAAESNGRKFATAEATGYFVGGMAAGNQAILQDGADGVNVWTDIGQFGLGALSEVVPTGPAIVTGAAKDALGMIGDGAAPSPADKKNYVDQLLATATPTRTGMANNDSIATSALSTYLGHVYTPG